MKPKTLPPVIERRPKNSAEVRRVIRAAERGERLWCEGDEGIVTPLLTAEQGIAMVAQKMREVVEISTPWPEGVRIKLPGD